MGSMEAVLDALANPRRREIVRLVWSAELSSREIADHFDVTWQAVSQNLRVLSEAGLLKVRRDGTRKLYRADRAVLRPLAKVLEKIWEPSLDRLAALAERDERRKGRRR